MHTLDWRDGLPREHALIGWVAVPALGALALAGSLPGTLGALAVIFGFVSFNAASRVFRGSTRAVPLAIGAGATAAVVALGAALMGAQGAGFLAGFGALGVAALSGSRALGGQLPRQQDLEVGGIAVASALAALVAWNGGVPSEIAVRFALGTTAWFTASLYWVNASLAPLLPGRVPWPNGRSKAFFVITACGIQAWAWGSLGVALFPLVYGVRTVAHDPPTHARDVRRVGLQELGWAFAATFGIASLAISG